MGFWEGFFVGKYVGEGSRGGSSDNSGCGCGTMTVVFIIALILLPSVGAFITGSIKLGLGVFGYIFFPSLWDVIFDVFIGMNGKKTLLMLGLMVSIPAVLIFIKVFIIDNIINILKLSKKVKGFIDYLFTMYIFATLVFLGIRFVYYLIKYIL